MEGGKCTFSFFSSSTSTRNEGLRPYDKELTAVEPKENRYDDDDILNILIKDCPFVCSRSVDAFSSMSQNMVFQFVPFLMERQVLDIGYLDNAKLLEMGSSFRST